METHGCRSGVRGVLGSERLLFCSGAVCAYFVQIDATRRDDSEQSFGVFGNRGRVGGPVHRLKVCKHFRIELKYCRVTHVFLVMISCRFQIAHED